MLKLSIVEGDNMKPRKTLFIIFILTLLLITNVNAEECSFQERANINTISSKVKATYGVKTVKMNKEDHNSEEDIYYSYFEISIYNIQPEIYIVLTNDQDETEQTIYYNNTIDGEYVFAIDVPQSVTTYTIDIYSSGIDGCEIEKNRSLTLKIPKQNKYYTYAICEGLTNLSYCQEFITFDEPSISVLEDKIRQYNNTGEDDQSPEVVEEPSFIESYRTILIVSGLIILVAGIGVVSVILHNKRKGRKPREIF